MLDLLQAFHKRAHNSGQQGILDTTNAASEFISPAAQDFFYICAGHLTDRGFAIADKDELAAAEARKKKTELDAEIEKIKKKAEKKAEKKKDGKVESKDDAKKDKEEEKADENELDDKVSCRTIECCRERFSLLT